MVMLRTSAFEEPPLRLAQAIEIAASKLVLEHLKAEREIARKAGEE